MVMNKVLITEGALINTWTLNSMLMQKQVSVSSSTVDGYELLQHLCTSHEMPDVLIMDIQIAKIDGIALCYYIKHHFPDIKIILLSMYNDTSFAFQAFNSGANGFLTKESIENNLLTTIKSVQQNKLYVDGLIKISADDIARHSNYRLSEEKFKRFGLTIREKTFLLLSATKLQYAEIAKLMFVETGTVQAYFERVSKKLQVKSRQELTLFSLQYGLAKLLFYQS